ncbi:PhoD-like phosphatase-domain-containing protein [Amylocystis lapponica]|nr:PhoD-like phosphatase-domain-containing protein [Amylocystis lapponica]
MTAKVAYATSVLSTLFRLVAYVFLEVVPTSRLGKYVLPGLYVLYVTLTGLQLVSRAPAVKQEVSATDTKAVEGVEIDSKDSTDVAPPPPPVKESSPYASILSSIIFTAPTKSLGLQVTNLVINSLLILAAIDFVTYPYFDNASDVTFTRVGAVYPDSAKIVVRYPTTDSTDHQVRIAWRQAANSDVSADNSNSWRHGPLVNLTSENDWVSTVKLDGLWPRTHYEYKLEDADETTLPYPANPIRFRTFPDPLLHSGSYFRFLASSCITPNFPYVPFQGRRIKGFDLLADSVWPAEASVPSAVQIAAQSSAAPAPLTEASITDAESAGTTSADDVPLSTPSTSTIAAPVPTRVEPPTEFMIFMGDFIYADVPLYFGDDQESYRRLYRRNYQSDSFRKVYERLPIFHTYDDHEIINNYAGASNDSQAPFPNASDAFRLYNADANYDSAAEGQHYYDFRYGDVAFFVMDTRRHRSTYETDAASRTMLGDKQLAALYDWLGKVNNTATFKFIVTSVPFTSLWQYEAQFDSWAGYAYEKTALLGALHSVPNVILLSGDRHEFAAIEYRSPSPGSTVLEVSTSPLSMFYVPFVRTLKMKSEGVVQQIKKVAADTETEETEIIEEVPQEQVLKYLPLGNHKWSALEVDTRNPERPTVQVQIMIEGVEAYKLLVVGQPVNFHPETALGAFVERSFKGVLDKFGLKPGNWF